MFDRNETEWFGVSDNGLRNTEFREALIEYLKVLTLVRRAVDHRVFTSH